MVSSSRPCKSLAGRGQPAPTCRARGHRRAANRGASGTRSRKKVARRRISKNNLSSPGTSPVRQPGGVRHAQQEEGRATAHLKKQLVEPGDIAGPPTGGRPDTRSRKNVARRRINLSSPGTSPVRQPGGVRTRAAERTSRDGASTCRARGHRRSANRGASGHAQQKERRATAHFSLDNILTAGCSQSRMRAARALRPLCRVAAALWPARTIRTDPGAPIGAHKRFQLVEKKGFTIDP